MGFLDEEYRIFKPKNSDNCKKVMYNETLSLNVTPCEQKTFYNIKILNNFKEISQVKLKLCH